MIFIDRIIGGMQLQADGGGRSCMDWDQLLMNVMTPEIDMMQVASRTGFISSISRVDILTIISMISASAPPLCSVHILEQLARRLDESTICQCGHYSSNKVQLGTLTPELIRVILLTNFDIHHDHGTRFK
jgi:hypothetical protein